MSRVMERARSAMRGMKPHVVDPWAFVIVTVAFAVGVLLVAWHGHSLRFEMDAANLGWIVIVAFGVTWHGEWGSGWRVAGGLLLGGLAAIAGFYGSLSRLPVTPLGVGIGMAVTAAGIVVLAHAFPRTFSFAGAAVGFGVGVAAARSVALRPTTPLDDMFTLMLTVAMTIVLGAASSLALRAFVIRIGIKRPGEYRVLHLPHWAHRAAEEMHEAPAQRQRAAR